jgi:hypothetical protein
MATEVSGTAPAASAASTLDMTAAATTTPTLPVPTEQLQAWYTADSVPVYACAQVTCDVLTNFPAGVQLLVIGTENGWHEILLARQRGRYVEARLTTQSTPQPGTATAASAQVGQPTGQNPPIGGAPVQNPPPTLSSDQLPPIPSGTNVQRTTPQPTVTFPAAPPLTPQSTQTMPPLPPGITPQSTATPQGTLQPPTLPAGATATFSLPNQTIVPLTPTATAPQAPPGINPNLPTATPFNPVPPGV